MYITGFRTDVAGSNTRATLSTASAVNLTLREIIESNVIVIVGLELVSNMTISLKITCADL